MMMKYRWDVQYSSGISVRYTDLGRLLNPLPHILYVSIRGRVTITSVCTVLPNIVCRLSTAHCKHITYAGLCPRSVLAQPSIVVSRSSRQLAPISHAYEVWNLSRTKNGNPLSLHGLDHRCVFVCVPSRPTTGHVFIPVSTPP